VLNSKLALLKLIMQKQLRHKASIKIIRPVLLFCLWITRTEKNKEMLTKLQSNPSIELMETFSLKKKIPPKSKKLTQEANNENVIKELIFIILDLLEN
jgi:hypothetical protein